MSLPPPRLPEPQECAPETIHWSGLRIHPAEGGGLAQVIEEATGETLMVDLRMGFDAEWEQVRLDRLPDEQEVEWRHPSQVRAIVRQVFDQQWTMRISLVNESGHRVEVPAPWWDFQTSWPARYWLAGAEGSVALNRGDSSLVFTQLRGHSDLVDGRVRLAGDPIVLTAEGAGAHYLVSWRADWIDDERRIAATLPSWWPAEVALGEGDSCLLELPDAGVTSSDVQIVDDAQGTWVTAGEGGHTVQVHHRHGTTDLRLWWSPDPEQDLVDRVRSIRLGDPRRATPAEAWLAQRAARLDLMPADDWLATAVDSVLATPGTPDVFAVLAAADQVSDEPELVDVVAELVRRLPAVPGASLARLAARVAGASVGTRIAVAIPVPDATLDPVAAAIVAAEVEAMAPGEQPSLTMRRVLGLLGAGLPGDVGTATQRAIVVAISALLPEEWEFERWWPVGVPQAREQARRRLLAEGHSNELVAWLWW